LEVHGVFWWRYLRERDHLEDLGVDGRITLRIYLQEVACGDMEWIVVAQDRNRWRKLVNAVMNIWFPHYAGNFLIR
jgi:hypothetical protein